MLADEYLAEVIQRSPVSEDHTMDSHGSSSIAALRCSPLTESAVPPEGAQFSGATELITGVSNENRPIAVPQTLPRQVCELVSVSGDRESLSV